MRLYFSQVPLRNRAFSDKPMTFCDPDSKNVLSAIIDLIAIDGAIVLRVNTGGPLNFAIF
jgi:hypothetical protein